jgi:hypothetical protein
MFVTACYFNATKIFIWESKGLNEREKLGPLLLFNPRWIFPYLIQLRRPEVAYLDQSISFKILEQNQPENCWYGGAKGGGASASVRWWRCYSPAAYFYQCRKGIIYNSVLVRSGMHVLNMGNVAKL